MAGLAPVPFAGMVLSDFGADVVRVDRNGPVAIPDVLARSAILEAAPLFMFIAACACTGVSDLLLLM